MLEQKNMSEPDNEMEAVRTTIVGGSSSGSGRSEGTIPTGIEVMLKKAAVDAEFRERLFAERGSAAAAIELELDPTERAMLEAIPRAQLESIVAQTVVPLEQRRVFLGRLAAPMLAVLGAAMTGCQPKPTTLGIRPAAPPTNQPPAGSLQAKDGIRPDRPPTNQPPAQAQPAVPPATNSFPTPGTAGVRPDRPPNG